MSDVNGAFCLRDDGSLRAYTGQWHTVLAGDLSDDFAAAGVSNVFFHADVADIIDIDSNGATLECSCAIGKNYTIFRSTSPGGNVAAIEAVSVVTEIGYIASVDINAGDDCFYWIQQS